MTGSDSRYLPLPLPGRSHHRRLLSTLAACQHPSTSEFSRRRFHPRPIGTYPAGTRCDADSRFARCVGALDAFGRAEACRLVR